MIAILSDIHANLAALEAVLVDIDQRNIKQILCLGDVVGYNAQPDECITLLRERDIPCLMGNHDSYLTSEQNCERSRVVAEIIDDHKKMVSPQNLSWLACAKTQFNLGTDMLFHGGPENPTDQYIYEVDETIFPQGVKRLFVGHTHIQCVLKFKSHVFCNPGSVGQPRDGDPKAAYVTISSDNIECHRVSYDIEKTVEAAKARGYEPFKYEGLWLGSQIGGRIDKIIKV